MSSRTLALGFALLMLAAAIPAVSNATQEARPALPLWMILGDAPGVRVLDDYGAFVTARLTTAEADGLRADGLLVEPLTTTLHRGGWTLTGSDAAVPADMRAGALDPYFLVQFRGPVKEAWRAALEANSLRVFDAIPNYAFIVKLAPGQDAALRAMPEVAFVGAHHPAYKLAPELPSAGAASVSILTFPGEPTLRAATQVAYLGGTVRDIGTTYPGDGIVKALLPAANVADLALLPEVAWIEPSFDEIGLDNVQASAISQTGELGNYRVHDKGVKGASQILSVCDTGVKTAGVVPAIVPQMARRMQHEMYNELLIEGAPPAAGAANGKPLLWLLNNGGALVNHRKMQAYYPPVPPGGEPGGDFDDTSGHGTHTAGTIAGDAPPYGVRNGNDGVAFAAKLMVCDITNSAGAFFIASDYSLYWEPAYSAGARVNSNSWGSPHTTAYTEVARQHDAYVADHRDFVILRSMGNTGGNTIRPEAVAKNALGIGATANGAAMENLASFSSRGPTQDGRIKPDVIAPGACLVSAGTGANNYACLSGTSMSTPTVAGSAGLVRDYFVQGFYPSGTATEADSLNPSTALVRGVLMASAKRITGSLSGTGFPNKDQGWGRVNLDDAMFFGGDARKLFVKDEATGLATGETQTFSLTIAAGQPLRIQLVWSDEAAAAGANPALVNDLDLSVAGPSGTHIGNAFVNGEVPPGQGTRDARNVEEAVYLNAPAAGTYTITVRGANVPSGPQTFALVATHG